MSSRHRSACRRRRKIAQLGGHSHIYKCHAFLSGYLVSGRVPANSNMPYGGRAGICSVPVEWPAMYGRCLADLPPGAANSAGGRRLTGNIDCLGCSKFGPAPTRCVRCPTGHRPGIDRFIGDLIAMRNAARCFKSELKVTRCPRDSQK